MARGSIFYPTGDAGASCRATGRPTATGRLRGGTPPQKLFEQSRRVGTEFLCELLGVSAPPAPPVRVALRGFMGAVDEMCADWLTHGCDLELEQLVHLAYTTVVAILSTVCSAGRELAEHVGEFAPSGGTVG